MKRMLQSKIQQDQQNQQATFQAQNQSAITAETEKRKTLQMELEFKKQMNDSQTANELKVVISTGFFGIYQKGFPIPAEMKTAEQEWIQNVAEPLFMENMQSIHALMQNQEQQSDQEPQEELQNKTQQ